ncbi:MAG TPA: hypothetical protein VIN40_10945 [Candidatus Tyrphobacter sp.]
MNQEQTYLQIAIWSQVVSAVVFMAALIYIWGRWLQPTVLAAQERSNRQIAEAERHRDDAEAALTALRAEIENAHADADLIRARANTYAEHERQAALAEAAEAGERALRNARAELDRARAAARLRLRVELADKALAVARSDAERRIDARGNARLVEHFLATLESARS